MMMLRLSLLAFSLLAGTALLDSAQATSSTALTTQQQWGRMDKCARQAIDKFPDHTAEDLAKRDNFARQCQRNLRVPVREGMAPK
jgi:hypothetical protein